MKNLHRKGLVLSLSKGFTLVEMLMVVAIISVLAITVFSAINPSKRIKNAKDDRRLVDIDSLLTAIHSYTIDNKGSLPSGLTAGMVEKQLGTGGSGCNISTNGCAVSGSADCVDLSTPLVDYLRFIPQDPDGTAVLTKYSVIVTSNGMVTVKACGAEGGSNLWISR
jgi:prepilin-type N-terminal cleavage/methylation domain-containing protein